MSEAAWNKAFTQGSSALKKRLMDVHAKNPKFQSWLKSSGHGAGVSVKQASKEVKPTERVKKLQTKSLQAYGATKGLKVGGEHGSGEMKDTIAPLTRDQHSKVQAAARAAKAAEKSAAPKAVAAKKTPLTKSQRMAAIAAAVRKAQTKHDVPTMEPDDEGHDDLRDVHQSLHIRKGYNEEVEQVAEGRMKDIVTNRQETERLKAQKILGGPVKSKASAIGGAGQPKNLRNLTTRLATRAMKAGQSVTESTEESQMKKGRMLALAVMKKNQSKHPIAQEMGEEVVNEFAFEPKHSADAGEYDYEGDMAKSQLRSIITNAKRLHDMLEDTTNLPEWVQSKITLAEDYVLTAANYMEGEMNEEVEQIDEATHFQYSGEVNGKKYEVTIPRHKDLGDYSDGALHRKLSKENPHLAHHEVTAIVDSGGEEESKVDVEHKGKKYTHHVINHQEPERLYNEEVEQIDEGGHIYTKHPKTGKLHRVGSFKEMPLKFYDHPTKPTPSAKEIRAALAKRNPHLDPEHIDAIAQTSGASNPAGRGKNRLFINHSDNSVGRKYIKQELGIREEVEQVTEAEGKVAVTPREKDLAAHHGDPKKITYGDVIKARLKSAAAKKMGK
jgi:hypothetical protein